MALVPFSVLGELQPSPQVAVIELEEPWALRELTLVVRQDAKFPAYMQEFMNFLLEDPRVAATRATSIPGPDRSE